MLIREEEMSRSKRKIIMGYDLASKKGDCNSIVCGYIDGKGILHTEELKGHKVKEVKKVSRPYFETKVVEVGKVKKCKHKTINMASNNKFYCGNCGEEIIHNCSKGNWVNGENLDKIKFPCFCSYGGSQYGMITRTKANEAFDNEFYTLHGIGKQHSSFSSIRSYYNFADLIRVWDIHIQKAK